MKIDRLRLMSPTAVRVAQAVYRYSPGAVCFSCLAKQEGLQEHDVRAMALVLICRAGLHAVQRSCASCHRLGDTLIAQKAA
jgi:hypothetical protein